MLLLARQRQHGLRRQVVVSADDVTVDDAVLVAGDEAAVAGGTREALEVVDGARLAAGGRSQHHLARRDVLTATGARARRPEHSAHTANTFVFQREFFLIGRSQHSQECKDPSRPCFFLTRVLLGSFCHHHHHHFRHIMHVARLLFCVLSVLSCFCLYCSILLYATSQGE